MRSLTSIVIVLLSAATLQTWLLVGFAAMTEFATHASNH